MPKSDPTIGEDLEARYELIEGLIGEGMLKRHVTQYIRENDAKLGWGLSDRQLRNYYDTVIKRMADGAARIDRRMYHVRSIKRLDYLYRSAVEATQTRPDNAPKERKNALDAEQTLIHLLHLDAPEHEMDWRKAAEQAGLDADSILARMLESHAAMDASE